MLLISEEQFLKELATEKSSSLKFFDPKAVVTNPITTEGKDTSIPLVPDEIKMENATYDKFRKPNGVPNIPDEVKVIAATLGTITNQGDVAQALGISKDTVGNLVNDNHKNSEVIEKKLDSIQKLKNNIVTKVEQCVEFLDVVKEMPKKELLATAESLSRIHRNITTPAEGTVGAGVQFIFYAPERQHRLDEYEVINAPN